MIYPPRHKIYDNMAIDRDVKEVAVNIVAFTGGAIGGELIEDGVANAGVIWFGPDPALNGRIITTLSGLAVTVGGIAALLAGGKFEAVEKFVTYLGAGILANGLADLILYDLIPPATVSAVPVSSVPGVYVSSKPRVEIARTAENVIAINGY